MFVSIGVVDADGINFQEALPTTIMGIKTEKKDEDKLAFEAAKKLLARYRSSRKTTEVEKQQRRIAGFLSRRGFAWMTTNTVLRKLFKNETLTSHQES